MKIKKTILKSTLVSLMVLSATMSVKADVVNKEDTVHKVCGKTRYETNIETIKEGFGNSFENISMAKSENEEDIVRAINIANSKDIPFSFERNKEYFSDKNIDNSSELNFDNAIIVNHMTDLISSLGYAIKNKSEIIYNDGNHLDQEKMSKYKKVLIVGGRVNNENGYEKISGKDRYETNRKINEKNKTTQDILVSGENLADAISAINIAKHKDANIILTKNDGSSVDINNSKIDTIVGGAVKVNRRVLYLNPHQDDEVITLGASIAKDTTDKKDVHLILLTDGSRTASINSINRDLEKLGKKKITKKEIVYSRNQEMTDSCIALGMNKSKIYFANYENLTLTKDEVYNEILNFYNKYKNIELKTMAVNKYDKSKGNVDHLACKLGAIKFAKDYNLNRTLLSRQGGDYDIEVTPEMRKRIINAGKAYSVWDINKGRYAVGHHSVGSIFDDIENLIYGVNYN